MESRTRRSVPSFDRFDQEAASGFCKHHGTIGPELLRDLQPVENLAAEISLAGLAGNSELRDETFWPKEGNADWALGRPAAPD